jgi:6-phosphogluconolactonase
MLPEIVVRDSAGLAESLAALLTREAESALAARASFSVALSGGSVATSFFPRLARLPVDWSRTDFFWCDERAVPPTDPESNYAAARVLWLEPAGVPAARVHRMPADAPDLATAARGYERELVRALGETPRLDLVLLGVGPDGHVASLFPGHRTLGEEQRLVLAVEDSPKPPPRRLTLSLPPLTAARLVVVAALGAAKAEVVQEALEDAHSVLPLALVLRGAARSAVLLDADAAARLRGR